MDLFGLLPGFGNIFFTLGAFVVALSVIVAVHEYGHYIVGRWSGIHAEVFSIGFGPVLFSRVDRHGTQWQVAALPFGGYVKFLGDANAASAGADGEAVAQMTAAQRRRTMHGAPLWARSATVAAGPIFNFIFSIIVFATYIGVQGLPADEPRLGTVHPMPAPAQAMQPGDLITAIEGQPVESLTDFFRLADELPGAPALNYTVERDGRVLQLQGPHPVPARAEGITLQSAAREAGLQAGDVILAVNDQPIWAFSELPPIVSASEGAPVDLLIWRGGEEISLTLTPRRTDLPLRDGGFETRWLIGLQSGAFFELPTRTAGPVEVLPLATQQTWDVIMRSFSGLYHMVVGSISTCNLSGPIGIATTSGAMAADGIWPFIWFIAVLSTAVGLLNLFPIPILDGGHLVFHAYEAVTGKPPSERVLGVLMAIGLALLGTLMLFAIATDLLC
ncbi:MAG: RIP metalloprotease RseP [Pararhodobacter sp.]|nr:RIP metalloprotease RseP [Pararhodobacter sp.]